MKARVLACSLLLASLIAAPAAVQSAQREPMLGARLSPSKLTLQDRRATTTIVNRGNIPVNVSADARLWSLMALGYKVTVEPSTLAPEQAATVTLKRRKGTPPSPVTLSILMGPKTRGMDSGALRFPVLVETPDATTTSTLAALVTAWAWTPNGPR